MIILLINTDSPEKNCNIRHRIMFTGNHNRPQSAVFGQCKIVGYRFGISELCNKICGILQFIILFILLRFILPNSIFVLSYFHSLTLKQMWSQVNKLLSCKLNHNTFCMQTEHTGTTISVKISAISWFVGSQSTEHSMWLAVPLQVFNELNLRCLWRKRKRHFASLQLYFVSLNL